MSALLSIALTAFIFCVGVAIGYDIARRKNQKGPLEVGSVVAPPGSTVLLKTADDLSEHESELLGEWISRASERNPGVAFEVVFDGLFTIHSIKKS